MTASRVNLAGLSIAEPLASWVEKEALESTTLSSMQFWKGVKAILNDFTPRNRELLETRTVLQAQIDQYHRAHPGLPDPDIYRSFLESIGYLQAPPQEFIISTSGVDEEISRRAAPQLVVPLLNARFAINAANARWGSLYDALYGTDAITDDGNLARGQVYNPTRGAEVIRRGRRLLNDIAPLLAGSHADATSYSVREEQLVVQLNGGSTSTLQDPSALAGYLGVANSPDGILLRHHGLHAEIVIDPDHQIGRADPAGVADLLVESALTTIMDLEDSVAAVDAEDKTLGYRNWRALMTRTLTEEVIKSGRTFTRTMNHDREYTAPDGSALVLPGTSLLLIRIVGHLMTTDAVLDDGQEVPEGILDTIMTALGALPDLKAGSSHNSRTSSVYIVKPKMHGADEVEFAVELFARVEQLVGLPAKTLKIGIMDEERRTTLNLRACIAAARDRVFFINTGFLDRTGDEIHTSLHAGPMVAKAEMRNRPFLQAYESANVAAGLRAGFSGRAQIGKGMWAAPDHMHDLLQQKVSQVRSGATTAWVPSPTAATLHALHYHAIDAFAVGAERAHQPEQALDPILVPPLATSGLSSDIVATELDNNVQSILGYVVRWIDQGIGCSKVPDIHGVALMEDRATLRISSQLLANWLQHRVITLEDVDASLQRLSRVVDDQNRDDPLYQPLFSVDGPGMAYETARRLIAEGATQPSGYTEPILHEMRRTRKQSQ